MSVKVRLMRTGGKNDVSYRLVATDSRRARDGRCLEILGWYDPKIQGLNFNLKLERIEYWKSKGAELSATVKSLLKRQAKASAAV